MPHVHDRHDVKRRLEGAALVSGCLPALSASGLRLYDRTGRVQFFRPAVTPAALAQLESVAEEIGSERRGESPTCYE